VSKKNHAHRRRVAEAWAAMQAAFPHAFPADDAQIRPLAISTRDDLMEWLETAKLGLCRKCAIAALHKHCGRLTYKQTLLTPGAMRITLHGNPVEPVTPEAAEHAREYIERARVERAQAEIRRAEAQAEQARQQAEAEQRRAVKAKEKPKEKAPAKAAKPTPMAQAPAPIKTQAPKPAAAVIVKKKRRVITAG
jgi:sRNA-binding protein